MEATPIPTANRPRLLDQLRDAVRRRHYSCRTEMAGQDIRTIQELLGHRDVSNTMIYTHVLGRGTRAVTSPFDLLDAASHMGAHG